MPGMRAIHIVIVASLFAFGLAVITAPPFNPLVPVGGCAIGPGQATAEGFLWLALGGLLWLLARRRPRV